jgi:hypothetical protein
MPIRAPVDQRDEVRGELGGPLHGLLLAEPGGQHRPLEAGLVGLVLDLGGQPQALGVGPADPGQPPLVEDPAGQGVRHQRDHLELVLADRLVRRGPGEPGRLQRLPQRLQADPGLLAHLPEGPLRRQRPALVGGGLQEGERQPAGPDGRGDPVHRQPGALAGRGQADLVEVAGKERGRPVAGDQDAEVDQAADLGLGQPGQGGQPGGGQGLHAAILRRRRG